MFFKKYLISHLILFACGYCLNTSYLLQISEGNNFFDLGQLNKALTHYKKAIEIKKEAADAYLQIGHIHLLKEFNQLALKNFKKAESFSNHFLTKESLLDLYMNMSATYHQEKYLEQEMIYLQKILSIATNYKEEFYRDYTGKSLFLLGLLENKKGRKAVGKKYFLKAASYSYRLKSCFLYLSHYYAITSQKKIDADLNFFSPNIKRTENRNTLFDYYYEQYESTTVSEAEKNIFKKKSYQRYLEDIEEYKRLKENQKSPQPP